MDIKKGSTDEKNIKKRWVLNNRFEIISLNNKFWSLYEKRNKTFHFSGINHVFKAV